MSNRVNVELAWQICNRQSAILIVNLKNCKLMSNYDLLVAVVREKGAAASLNWSAFLVGTSLMCVVALIVLMTRTKDTNNDGALEDQA